jgi:hypothetical protein
MSVKGMMEPITTLEASINAIYRSDWMRNSVVPDKMGLQTYLSPGIERRVSGILNSARSTSDYECAGREL